jgi:secreted PhoX family phosphatase
MSKQFSRRDFLKFLGAGTALAAFNFSACNKLSSSGFDFLEIGANFDDKFVLPFGFKYEIIRSWQDPINQSQLFGTNNDYLAFFNLDQEDKALLWVNHEGIDQQFIRDYHEQKMSVGGSVIAIEKIKGKWQFSSNKELQEKYNCRYDANTPVKYSGPAATILGDYHGTLANCSGGVTPWNTVLTCEENYNHFTKYYNWPNFKDEYYGWVVEIDPYTKNDTPVKHTALGRFMHENATTTLSKNNKLVVYMGDDTANEHVYKYVSNQSYQGEKRASHLLSDGKLYVAKLDPNSNKGTWDLIDINDPRIAKEFSSQAEVLIETRKAAKLIGATELNRPEDIEISPIDKSIFIAQTHNPQKDDTHGSILKFVEQDQDHEALEFSYEYFLEGGQELSITCPDNLAFDEKGNLWVATDIYGPDLHHGDYKYHGNNSLYFIPMSGPNAGQPKRFASAPLGAEITGPCFSSDFKTLFLSIQHPGEVLNSHWPDGGMPRSSVLAINL